MHDTMHDGKLTIFKLKIMLFYAGKLKNDKKKQKNRVQPVAIQFENKSNTMQLTIFEMSFRKWDCERAIIQHTL